MSPIILKKAFRLSGPGAALLRRDYRRARLSGIPALQLSKLVRAAGPVVFSVKSLLFLHADCFQKFKN